MVYIAQVLPIVVHTLCDSAVLDPALEDYRASVAFADTEMAADVLMQTATRCALAAVDVSQIAKWAAGGFFGVAAVRGDKRAAREELRRAVEWVRELEALASRHSPLFGEWKLPEGARGRGRPYSTRRCPMLGSRALTRA